MQNYANSVPAPQQLMVVQDVNQATNLQTVVLVLMVSSSMNVIKPAEVSCVASIYILNEG